MKIVKEVETGVSRSLGITMAVTLCLHAQTYLPRTAARSRPFLPPTSFHFRGLCISTDPFLLMCYPLTHSLQVAREHGRVYFCHLYLSGTQTGTSFVFKASPHSSPSSSRSSDLHKPFFKLDKYSYKS